MKGGNSPFMRINFSYTLMRKYIVILLTLLSLHPMSGQIIDTASIKVYYIEQNNGATTQPRKEDEGKCQK